MMNNNCAPNIYIDSSNHYTCFTKDELLSIIYALNNYHINQSIKNNSDDFEQMINLNGIETTKNLWDKIYNNLKSFCDYESCWIDLDFVKKIKDKKLRDKIRFFTFKPKFYNNDNDFLLTTDDINNVMNQYNYKYKDSNDFYYLGTFPCDFYTYTKINFKKLKTYNNIGIVFNLDTHDKPGTHWTSLFINNKTCNIYYFDSLGNEPNSHIKNFIKLYISKNKNKFNVYINKHKHQKENKECGVYSIYFLIKKLENSFDDNEIIPDEKMSEYRKHIFIQ